MTSVSSEAEKTTDKSDRENCDKGQMKPEIEAAAKFLMELLTKASFGREVAENFRRSLEPLLYTRYTGHWFPEFPMKGSGFRCLRINGKMEPLVAVAAQKSGLSPFALRRAFPQELTVWVDPGEVSYRIGEEGSICVLFESAEDKPDRRRQMKDLCRGKTGKTEKAMEWKMEKINVFGSKGKFFAPSLPWISTLGSA